MSRPKAPDSKGFAAKGGKSCHAPRIRPLRPLHRFRSYPSLHPVAVASGALQRPCRAVLSPWSFCDPCHGLPSRPFQVAVAVATGRKLSPWISAILFLKSENRLRVVFALFAPGGARASPRAALNMPHRLVSSGHTAPHAVLQARPSGRLRAKSWLCGWTTAISGHKLDHRVQF